MKRRLFPALAALLLPLASGLALMATAGPASAAIFYDQGDPQGYYLNWWGGGTVLATYGGVTYNDYTQVVPIGGGRFELVDDVSGGCVGNLGGAEGIERAGGGDYCPSTGTAGWGTIFTVGAPCGNTGYVLYFNQHSGAYVTFTNGNDNRVYLNGAGTCLKQQDP